MLEKRDVLRYVLVGMIVVVLIGILMVLRGEITGMWITGFAVYEYSGGDLSTGIFNNTFYNSSGFVQVNNSVENAEEMIGSESGLIFYWRMNESSWDGSSGEVKDVLGVNNGTSVNGANTVSGLFGSAGTFDGNDDYVNLGNLFSSVQDSGTVSFWFKSSDTVSTIVSQDASGWNNLDVSIGIGEQNSITTPCTNGYLCVDVHGPSTDSYRGVDSGETVNDDEWHFAVLGFNDTGYYLYLDGSLKDTEVYNGGFWGSDGNQDIYVGQTQDRNYYSGLVDELAFWNRDLNASEILEIYQKGNVSSALTTGTYESEVIDAGSIVNWTNISWNGGSFVNEIGKANAMFLRMNGDANDENGANNGTVNGAVNASGKYDSGYYFDGSNDYIQVSDHNSLDFGSSFSVGAWINISMLPLNNEWQGIIVKGGTGDGTGSDHNYFLALDQLSGWGSGIGIIFGYEDSSGNNYDTRLQIDSSYVGRWIHVVGVFNDSANTMTLYINGSQVSQDSDATATPTTQSEDVLIGRNMNGGEGIYYFNGTVDDAFVTNKSLSVSEILEIYDDNDYSSSEVDSDLKFQIKTSNDNSSWTNYLGLGGAGTYYNSPGDLNISDSKYLQYKSYFENSGSELYNVTIGYDTISDLTVSLDSPVDDYLTNEYNINVTCSVSSQLELVNATLYHDKFSWGAEETKSITGTSNTSVFTIIEVADSVKWNCLVCNPNGNCSFASSNKTIIGDIENPQITLEAPSDGASVVSSTPEFSFNATDNRASALDCSLVVSDVERASNSSVISGAISNIASSSLSNGNYLWYINCSDGVNSNVSETRNITVNSAAFWAKANTHGHTTESDGDSSPVSYIDKYKSLGYNILSITDHNPYGGYNNYTECESYNNLSENFICIHSEEFTLNVAHTTLNNINSAWLNGTNSIANVQNAINNAVAVGGFAVAAHPSWNSVGWSDSELANTYNYTGIEVYNKKIDVLTDGNPAQTYAVNRWDYLLGLGRRVFAVAVDDVHVLASEAGYGWTKVYVDELTAEEYVSKMNEGYFYASTGLSMDEQAFEINCDGLNVYHMGQEANCSSIEINATISASQGNNVSYIDLVKDGGVIYTKVCNSENCTFNFSQDVPLSGYYRLQANDTNDKWLWGNPIWITKVATPVVITVNSPENNSNILDYTPMLNVSLNQETSLWYNLNDGVNITLCANCSLYADYVSLPEGNNLINIYANNSDNVLYSEQIDVTLEFNKSAFDSFEDNSSIDSLENVVWSPGKISCLSGVEEGNFSAKVIVPSNNITSFSIGWVENNTGIEVWLHGVSPIRFFYKLNGGWIETDNDEEISGINNENLTYKFQFYKNSDYTIDLLQVNLTWTEFTVPLILNTGESTTSSSATITWETDTASNSSVEYGNSVLLGSVIGDSNTVTSHSITVPSLSSNTVYYYKISSCTVDSCAEYPQTPYPVDSFTTLSTGGGSGGGSSETRSFNDRRYNCC